MGFGESIRTVFSKYADFRGRARRSEFWWFSLFSFLVQLPFSIAFTVTYFMAVVPWVAQLDDTIDDDAFGEPQWGAFIVVAVLSFLVWAAIVVPSYAVWARRLHDMGQSGHWLWLNLASLGIVPLIMAFFDSERGTNRWGEDPKAAERPALAAPSPTQPPAQNPWGGPPPPGYGSPDQPAPPQ